MLLVWGRCACFAAAIVSDSQAARRGCRCRMCCAPQWATCDSTIARLPGPPQQGPAVPGDQDMSMQHSLPHNVLRSGIQAKFARESLEAIHKQERGGKAHSARSTLVCASSNAILHQVKKPNRVMRVIKPLPEPFRELGMLLGTRRARRRRETMERANDDGTRWGTHQKKTRRCCAACCTRTLEACTHTRDGTHRARMNLPRWPRARACVSSALPPAQGAPPPPKKEKHKGEKAKSVGARWWRHPQLWPRAVRLIAALRAP